MVRNNRSELEIPEQSPRGLEAEYGSMDDMDYMDDEEDL